MPLLRRLMLLGVTGLGAAVLAGPVFAARPGGLPNTVSTPHFVVHFQTDPDTTYAATQSTATYLAAFAERAYADILADGFAPPKSDVALGGDSRTDIYIADLTATGPLALATPDNYPTTSDSGYIQLNGVIPEQSFTAHVVAHELFHLVQFNVWATGGLADGWLYEGSAEWMGYRATDYDFSAGVEFGPSWLSLDCSDPQGGMGCDLADGYVNGGYSRWPFFEYLAEKFGSSFVKDAFAQAASGGTSATTGLGAAFAAKGSSLADTYNAWSTADMSGGYSLAGLQGVRPTPDGTVAAGAKSGTFLDALVPVDHLATSYLSITRGDGSSNQCHAATMTLTVTIPAGTSSKPAFFWDVKGSAATQLSVNGGTATITVPWDTCTWPGAQGLLSLPNASTTVDAADFRVVGTLSVDTAKITTATPPPELVPVSGVVSVPTNLVAPTIDVFGPELLKLGATDKEIRLIVQSSGEGLIQATLGSVVLGSKPLRGGNNDVRFTLPAGLSQSLRRSAAAGSVLTLTPATASGAVTGPPVTRKVNIAAQPKAKAKPKPAAKKKTKSRK